MITKFIQMCKNYQDLADTPEEAKKAFTISCNICCSRGIKLDCERCPVKVHHDIVVAALHDIREFDQKKKQLQ